MCDIVNKQVNKYLFYTNDFKFIEDNIYDKLVIIVESYIKGKTNITGYIYEPWHIRYLGIDIATKVKPLGKKFIFITIYGKIWVYPRWFLILCMVKY